MNLPEEVSDVTSIPVKVNPLTTEKEPSTPKYLVQVDRRKTCAFIILLKGQHLDPTQIKSITSFLKKEKVVNQDSKCYLAVLEENVTEDVYSGETQLTLKNPLNSSEEAILVIKTLELTRSNLENLIVPSTSIQQPLDVKEIASVWKQQVLDKTSVLEQLGNNSGETGEDDLEIELDETLRDEGSEDETGPPNKILRAVKTNEGENSSAFNLSLWEDRRLGSLLIKSWAERLTQDNLLPRNWMSCVTMRDDKIESDHVLNVFELQSKSSGVSVLRSVQIFSDGTIQVCINPFTCTDIFLPDSRTIDSVEALGDLVSKMKTYSSCAGFESVGPTPISGEVVLKGEKWHSRICNRVVPEESDNSGSSSRCLKCIELENSLRQVHRANVTLEAGNTPGNCVQVYSDGKFDVGQTIYANLDNFWDELKISEAARQFKSLPVKERR